MDFSGAVFFEEGGAGGEGVAGRGDIIDNPHSFIFEKIFRSVSTEFEGVSQIYFPRFFVLLPGLRKGEMNAEQGTCLRYEIELGRECICERACEELCLIESAPLLAPGVKRDEENDIWESEWRSLQFAREEIPERMSEAFRERIFVGMNYCRDKLITKW